MVNNRKFVLSDDLFQSFEMVIDLDVVETIEEIISLIVSMLFNVLRENKLDILKNIEANLQNDWLGGNEPNLTDIAILPFIRQFRGVDTDWFDNLSDISKTKSWTKRFLDWEGFTSIMKKYPQWKPGDCVTTFGVTSS